MQIAFPTKKTDDGFHSVYYGPHNAVAVFVEGYGHIGGDECEAIELALYQIKQRKRESGKS